jgi:hypothetical protein
MTEAMTYLEDGWVLWSRGRGGTTEGVMVYAQLWAEEEGDRGEIVQLVISGRDLARTEVTVTDDTGLTDAASIQRSPVPATDVTTDRLRSVPVAHIETLANTNPDFRPHVNGTQPLPISEAFSAFQQHANRIMMNAAYRKAYPRTPRKPLTRPDGSDPDGFYKQVADAYRDVLQTNRKVAVVLAEEAHVPVGTVHRWVLEARRRGFLPPARQGRAG